MAADRSVALNPPSSQPSSPPSSGVSSSGVPKVKAFVLPHTLPGKFLWLLTWRGHMLSGSADSVEEAERAGTEALTRFAPVAFEYVRAHPEAGAR